jgi:hypothetical protein
VTGGGGVGPAGPAGQAASIAVGTVTTGAPGSSASVVNVGNTNAAVFNFTIPQGAAGSSTYTGVTNGLGYIPANTNTALTANSSLNPNNLNGAFQATNAGLTQLQTGNGSSLTNMSVGYATNAGSAAIANLALNLSTNAVLVLSNMPSGVALTGSKNTFTSPQVFTNGITVTNGITAPGNSKIAGFNFNSGAGLDFGMQFPYVNASSGGQVSLQVGNSMVGGFTTLGATFPAYLKIGTSFAITPIGVYSGVVCTNGMAAQWNSNGVVLLRYSSIGATTWSEIKLSSTNGSGGGGTNVTTGITITQIVALYPSGLATNVYTNGLLVAVNPTYVVPPSTNSLLNGLLAYWSLDETVSPWLDMQTGATNEMTVVSGPATSISGIITNGVKFYNGPYAISAMTFGSVTGLTMCCWSRDNGEQVFGYRTNTFGLGNTGYYLDINNSACGFTIDGGSGTEQTASASSTGTGWHFFVGTYNRTNQILYVDGLPKTTNVYANTINLLNPMYLNYRGVYIDGQGTDECGLWNRALTPSEISSLYNSGAGNRP